LEPGAVKGEKNARQHGGRGQRQQVRTPAATIYVSILDGEAPWKFYFFMGLHRCP
jgi:hypothetical protein